MNLRFLILLTALFLVISCSAMAQYVADYYFWVVAFPFGMMGSSWEALVYRAQVEAKKTTMLRRRPRRNLGSQPKNNGGLMLRDHVISPSSDFWKDLTVSKQLAVPFVPRGGILPQNIPPHETELIKHPECFGEG